MLEHKENIVHRSELSNSLGSSAEREGALEAAAVSKALRVMARKASRLGAKRRFPERRRLSPLAIGGLVSFVLVVLLPTLFGAVYFGLLASPQYVSEVAFAVRGPTVTNDLIGGLSSIVNPERTQDALIVADYIRSRQLVEDLEGDIGLKERFTGASVDYLARLKPTASMEDTVLYWQSRVETKIDKNSGVVTVMVKAFSPADALDIAQAIKSRSERLANDLSERARQDSVRHAQAELDAAREKVQSSLDAASRIRNEKGVLDAAKSAEILSKVAGELRTHLLSLEANYELQRRTLSPTSPPMVTLAAQIAIAKEQISALDGRIAGAVEPGTLAGAQAELERHNLEVKLAEQRYATALARFEQARIEAKTKQVYLMTFISPRLAEEATYPKRVLMFSLVAGAGLAIWGALMGLGILVRDHVAV